MSCGWWPTLIPMMGPVSNRTALVAGLESQCFITSMTTPHASTDCTYRKGREMSDVENRSLIVFMSDVDLVNEAVKARNTIELLEDMLSNAKAKLNGIETERRMREALARD